MCFAVKRSIATVPAVLIKIPLSILADLFFKLYTSVHFFFFYFNLWTAAVLWTTS